ncbi:MAG TPA: PH domain-containing protein [Pyrinomonadaceae bacterium]|nr:PH domain-containing protein [Pyrinomonadaceae bacterium]
MFCIKCGTKNAEEAIFCLKCGNRFEVEEETQVAVRSTPDRSVVAGTKIFSISPTLKFIKVGYAAAVLAGLLFAALFSIIVPGSYGLIAVVIGLMFLLVPLYYHVRQKLVRYTLNETTIEIDRGLISRTTQNVPLRRIQDVTVSSTFFQRLMGYGDIVVDNASERGEKIVLDNVDSPRRYADMLMEQMRRIDRGRDDT